MKARLLLLIRDLFDLEDPDLGRAQARKRLLELTSQPRPISENPCVALRNGITIESSKKGTDTNTCQS